MKVGASFECEDRFGIYRFAGGGRGGQLAMKCLLVRHVIHEMNCFHFEV